ncbi:DNA primase [Litorivivens sp.]|uniref:DNA primase n=1 Tax=Litorivivens sp. TaxID=2020868 RepID=UPI00356AFF28
MAGLIPQHFIDELLARIDIVEVIDRRVPLRKTGQNYSALCPFHDEKTPSFSVNPDKQFYYCFGCGAGGNAIGFLMEYERQDFPQAVDTLAMVAGLEVPKERTEKPEKVARRKDLHGLMEQAARFYQKQLKEHRDSQRAKDYLVKRGLSGEIAKAFQIGFAPPGWDNLMKALASDDGTRQLLIDAGMLISSDDKCYDRFRDRIMFPILDNRGQVVAFGGRVLGDDKPKYLNSPETDIFHKGKELYGLYQARKTVRNLERLVIVEGYMDVVALAQHGIHYAVATLGTATSEDHLRKVFRYCPEVVFCFDGDEAGRKAARRAMETVLPLMEDGRQARFLFMPEGEDPDTQVRTIGTTRFENLILNATPLETHFFDALGAGLNIDSLEGKARLSKLAAPLIQRLPAGVYRELMLGDLAKRTGLTATALQNVLEHNPPAEAEPPPRREPRQKPPAPSLPESKRDTLLYMISLLLLHPASANALFDEALPALNNPYQKTLESVLALLRKRPESSTAMLLGHWQGQPEGEVLTRALSLEKPNYDAEKAALALKECLSHLHKQQHQSELRLTVDKLRNANYAELSEDDKQKLREMLQRKAHGD